ncbi:M23 family metallopeptidase [Salana multivorans]
MITISSRARAALLALAVAVLFVLASAPGAAAQLMRDGGTRLAPAAPPSGEAAIAGATGATGRDSPTGGDTDVAGGRDTTGDVVYDWPIGSGEVTRPFDDPAQPWLAGHRGVDLAGSEGAAVRAAADGVVAFAGVVAGKPVVSIDHADGIRTTYEPVVASVSRGQVVSRGEQIGTLAAGHGTGADLHWGARRGRDDYVDPTLLVNGSVVIRLYPTET